MAWRRVHIGPERDDGQVGGLPVWNHEWRKVGRDVRLPEGAQTNAQQTFQIYEIGGIGRPTQVRFAAAEISNGVWSFWEEREIGTKVDYLHLAPGQQPPSLENHPFKAVIVVDQVVDPAWQSLISDWLVSAGCLYMMAWGPDSSSWDDSVDWASLAASGFGDVPDDRFVMTTWHEDEPLAETFWFSGRVAHHPTMELTRTLIVEISLAAHRDEMLAAYADAQRK